MESKMISMAIYSDTTDQYTDSECNYCNCTIIDIPKTIAEKWYYEEIHGIYGDICNTFNEWLDFYTCDDTDGLYQFSIKNGYTPVCGKHCNGLVWYK